MSAVARRHGLTPQQLFGWRRHARQGSQERSSDNSVAFAPVIVEAAPPGAAIPIAPRLTIEIVVGAATVRIPPGDRCRDIADGTARRESGDMITVPADIRVLVATKLVDFRREDRGLGWLRAGWKRLARADVDVPMSTDVEVTDPTHPLYGRRFRLLHRTASLGGGGASPIANEIYNARYID